jgi:PAS domain S-box-containing protein
LAIVRLVERGRWSAVAAWPTLLIGASVVATALIDLFLFPTMNLAVIHVLPLALAGLLASPRGVAWVIVVVGWVDLASIVLSRPPGEIWILTFAVLIAVGLLARRFATQREQIGRLYESEHGSRLAAERAADRTARLQQVTASLANATTTAEVAAAIVDHLIFSLNAQAAAVLQLVDHDSCVEIIHTSGFAPNPTMRSDEQPVRSRIPLSAGVPPCEAIRTGCPIYLTNGAERLRRFPVVDLFRLSVGEGASVTLPFGVNGKPLGVVNVSFPTARSFGDDDQAFMQAIAQQCGLAFERVRLRETQARLAALVESSEDAIMSLTLDGTIQSWNVGSERMLGYSAVEALGENAAMLIPVALYDQMAGYVNRLRLGEIVEAEDVVLVDRRGRQIDVSIRASPIRDVDGRVVGVSAIARDVRAHKQAERAAQLLADAVEVATSETDPEAALAAVARLIAPTHADWCTIYLVDEKRFLRQVAAAAAVPEVEAILRAYGRTPHVLHLQPAVHALDRAIETGLTEMVSHIDESMVKNRPDSQRRLDAIRKLGYRDVLIVPLVARGQSLGAIVFSVGQSTDTRLIDRALAEELARRLALIIDRALLYRESQRAVQVRDEFLAVAAHELKTPITSLHGFAQLELQRLRQTDEVNPEHLRRALSVIDVQSQKLTRLVSRLLDVVRIDAGHFELRPTTANVSAIARQLASAVQAAHPRHDIRLAIDPVIVASVDPVRVEQMLFNLLDNAIKYSPDGGIVELVVHGTRSEVQIAIRDYGIGIPLESRDSIFDRFNQGDAANHRSGMGLGLYISRQITEMHGGRIFAEHPDGGGTRLVVVLPRRSDRIDRVAIAPRSAAASKVEAS